MFVLRMPMLSPTSLKLRTKCQQLFTNVRRRRNTSRHPGATSARFSVHRLNGWLLGKIASSAKLISFRSLKSIIRESVHLFSPGGTPDSTSWCRRLLICDDTSSRNTTSTNNYRSQHPILNLYLYFRGRLIYLVISSHIRTSV
jgi:hypothetical protein